MKKVWIFIKSHPWVTVMALFEAAYYGHMAFMAMGRQYFEVHCENDAGEFIYKTVDNVEGIYQIRPREPLYYFDNLRHYRNGRRELMEDPYGNTELEALEPWILFVRSKVNTSRNSYEYFETEKAPNLSNTGYPRPKLDEKVFDKGYPYWVYRSVRTISDSDNRSLYSVKNINKLQSRYGFTWRETRSFWDKFFGIWGGEILVKDLTTDEILAVKRGYFSFNFGICPKGKDSFFIYEFISRVLKPIPIQKYFTYELEGTEKLLK